MKNIKEFILEGAWGYGPNDNDGTLDLRGDIWFSICELIYDKCNEKHDKFETDYAWEALGNIEFFFEALSEIKEFGLNDEYEFNKYYYWWRLIDKKKTKNIINLYKKLLNKCKSDKKWIDGWKEPEKMQASLEERELVLQKYEQLFEDRQDYEKEAAKKRKECEKEAKQDEEQIEISAQ